MRARRTGPHLAEAPRAQSCCRPDSIEVQKADGTQVVLSMPDFNAANVPGFMRFVD